MHLKPAKTLIFFYGRELLAVDETLERRLGKKIKAKGVYRDVILSSQTHAVITIWVKIGVHATDCPIAMVQAAMGPAVCAAGIRRWGFFIKSSRYKLKEILAD